MYGRKSYPSESAGRSGFTASLPSYRGMPGSNEMRDTGIPVTGTWQMPPIPEVQPSFGQRKVR